MAALQTARRRSEFTEEDLPLRPVEPQGRFVQDNAPSPRPSSTVRPRIGAGPRTAAERRRVAHGTSLWRVMGVSAAVLVLGTGGLLGLHMVAPGDAALRSVNPPPVVNTHAAIATKVASVIGAPTVAPASPPPAASTGPTAEDFARPAFLEPISADDEDTPDNPAPAAATAAEAPAPADPAPMPAPRPRQLADVDASPAKAPADAEGKAARISMDVTLRSGPRRSASAIATLDEGTKVTLYSCKSWCEVAAGDKRGFVYRNAVAQ